MIIQNKGTWKQRLLVGSPVTGLMRVEWVNARYNQITPTNWGMADFKQLIDPCMPLRFQVCDAQNIIVEKVIREDYEWLFLVEQDNVLPADAFIRINQYMLKKSHPVVSGLYFTKSIPPEPIVYRGKGNSYFKDWKFGTKFYADGVPTGCILIHTSLLKTLWDESAEYRIGGVITRRVFEEPARIVWDQIGGGFRGEVGTSDLEFCSRVMRDKSLEKAGWPKFAKMKYPFLVDTGLFCGHIDEQGRNFPLGGIPVEYMPVKEKRVPKKAVT